MRRFTIIDAMALIVAAGVGFAVVREWAGPGFTARDVTLYGRVESVFAVVTAVCVYSALMLVVLGLRRPRPTIRIVCRQPGMAACVALVIGWLAYLAKGAVIAIHSRRLPSRFWSQVEQLTLASSTSVHELAPSIVIAWTILALSGRWRANPGWIDRVGRGIGVTLLGFYAFENARMYYLVWF